MIFPIARITSPRGSKMEAIPAALTNTGAKAVSTIDSRLSHRAERSPAYVSYPRHGPMQSPRSTGFCAIWGCISSSSSSKLARTRTNTEVYSLAPLCYFSPIGLPQLAALRDAHLLLPCSGLRLSLRGAGTVRCARGTEESAVEAADNRQGCRQGGGCNDSRISVS